MIAAQPHLQATGGTRCEKLELGSVCSCRTPRERLSPPAPEAHVSMAGWFAISEIILDGLKIRE